MSASPCRISTPEDPLPPYPPPSPSTGHPLGDLLSVVVDSKIPCEARLLFVILVLMAWTKGRCWPGIETQAGYLGRSEDSITRYHRELQARGLLLIERSGKYNQYYPSILQGQAPRPHRTGAGRGGASTRTGAALTPKRTKLQNVKNVGGTERPDWLDDYWSHLEGKNVENVVKSWSSEEIQALNPDDEDSPVRAHDDPATRTDTSEIRAPQYSSDVSLDQLHPALDPENARTLTGHPAPDTEELLYSSTDSGGRDRAELGTRTQVDCATGAACTPGDPDTPAPNTEKMKETSANSADQVRGDHFTRGENIPTRNPEKAQQISAKFEDRGDRGESPVRVPDNRGASTRTRKVFDLDLLNEILETTGDFKSRGCWITVLSQVPEEQIRYGLSCLRQAEVDGTMIERPGAYLLSVLREHNEIHFGRSKSRRSGTGVSPSTRTPDSVTSTVDSGHQVPMEPKRPVMVTSPPMPEPPPPSVEDLIKGWRFSLQALGLPKTLDLMERTVEGVNVRELWDQVKSLMPDSDPRSVADRFFQVVTTRLKHHAACEGNVT